MGSRPNPKTWIPYVNPRDCSQGICTLYCPQWCYIIFPPPPPFAFPDDDDSSPSFSPLVIALIGILASAFLLLSYYAMMSKYCRNRGSTNRRQNHVHSLEFEENQDPSLHVYWDVPTNGLDESLIKSITVFKYKKGDGLIEGTDCSICLSEFQEDESLRLLPKCSHAFHVTCIDTWLKSHSNCPLCRANIGSPRELPPPVMETRPGDEELTQTTPEDDHSAVVDDIEIGVRQQEIAQNVAHTTPESAPGDEQNSEIRSTLINIRTDEDQWVIRRSLSMDSPCQGRVSISDVLRTRNGEDYQPEECRFHGDAGCSKGQAAEMSRSSNRNNVLHCVTRPVAMKRSFSSGRFSFSNRGRGRNSIIPL